MEVAGRRSTGKLPADTEAIIRFSNVSASFSPDPPVLRDVTVEFARGSFNLIQGPSGSGKTTFLKLMNRLEEPARGEIYFHGKPLSSMDPPLLRTSVVYLQQLPTAIEGSVAENLCLPFRFKSHRGKVVPDRNRLKRLLGEFHLQGMDPDRDARTLSVGQLQRICFLRAMLLSPEVLLLDEPASGLDEESALTVERTAERLCVRSGLTVFLVAHRPFRPEAIAPSLFRLEDGRLKGERWTPP